ncbi:predicted protein [Plenodomus lingam JN3]|uniref:Predicted protein n=2 Tax=Leptosphaeria maculans TaxID=5022 RepID=E5A9H4_LEPMJ|nr:predicted protein [Plenodomus lingam JN3]CBY00315.1 predicted protein [Plenodomus lingam JN3]
MILISKQTQYPNKHKDLLHPDPALSFVSVAIFTATFPFVELRAMNMAKALWGHVKLPMTETLRSECNRTLKETRYGRFTANLHEKEKNLQGIMQRRTTLQIST